MISISVLDVMKNAEPNIIMKFHKSLRNASQLDKVASYLSEGKSFSTSEAKQAGIVNPTAVICKLRDEGMPIKTSFMILKSGAKRAVYSV